VWATEAPEFYQKFILMDLGEENNLAKKEKNGKIASEVNNANTGLIK